MTPKSFWIIMWLCFIVLGTAALMLLASPPSDPPMRVPSRGVPVLAANHPPPLVPHSVSRDCWASLSSSTTT
jgi:hypothetical protein